MTAIIEEITVWRTPDGEMFENQAEAYAHQDETVIETKISAFVAKHFGELTELARQDIEDILINHGREIVDAFESVKCQ